MHTLRCYRYRKAAAMLRDYRSFAEGERHISMLTRVTDLISGELTN